MKNVTIVLASLLKPTNDTRMYEKFALPLQEAGYRPIHVLGYASEGTTPPEGITFHTLFSGSRKSIQRIWANFKYYKLLLKLKPSIIIVNSPDLLIFTCIYKILFGSKILYDIQENYFANIRYTNTYPPYLKYMLGHFVRGVEHLLAPLFNHFILAEKCYEQELSFIGSKYTVIENKFRPPFANWQAPPPRFPSKGNIRLLYSGTIAEHYGIWEAIEIAEQLHAIDNGVTLTIIGYCAKPELWNQILVKTQPLSYISIIGGGKLVPHQEILKEISKSNIGLLTYQNNSSTANRIPTKYYEYISCNLISICTNSSMNLVFSKNELVVNFSNFNFSCLYQILILANNISDPDFSNTIYSDTVLLKTISSV